ncbi:MAG: hypothetical protein C0483_03670 [Pirellula sp.]|nr:hypothetical protein [Pirellula sp.]
MKTVIAAEYKPPKDKVIDQAIIRIANSYSGVLHSEDQPPESHCIELWFEFDTDEYAMAFSHAIRDAGYHPVHWGSWDD